MCDNLIDLARDTNYLVHEVTDPAATDKAVAGLPPDIAAGVGQQKGYVGNLIVGKDLMQIAVIR